MATSMRLSLAGALTETFRTLKKGFFNSYRPELHYMRGPGPRWREKQVLRPGRATPARGTGFAFPRATFISSAEARL
jgi:hypothetical protein